MLSFLSFWALLGGLLLSWELVLYSPSHIFYWFVLCLFCSFFLILILTKNVLDWKKGFADYISFILFCSGAFWWFLWLDFNVIKYAIPFVIWWFIVYFAKESRKMGVISKKEKLVIFFGGTFFWSAISFGLLTVLGWRLWYCLLIFVFSFSFLSFSSVGLISDLPMQKIKSWLLMILLSAEFFICFAWLPFAENTLSLITTLCVLFVYDFQKYYLDPGLIKRKIILKKIILYLLFFCLALASTPWY